MKKNDFYRKIPYKTVAAAAVMLFVMMAAVAFNSRAAEKVQPGPSMELFKHIQLFAEVVTLIDEEYVKKIEVKDLIRGAITGMLKTLDGYSQFLDEDSFKDMREETKGEFGGIGVEIGIRDGMLTIITPIEGTPAYEADLRSGDKVVKIDGEITRDIALDEAVRKLRGAPGAEVSITVMREDGEIAEVTIERAVIKLKSIKAAKIICDGIAYVKLVEFQERTARDLDSALETLKKEGASGLILDLRNNPGGLLDAAIEVSEKFLAKGDLIVYTEGRDREQRTEFFSGKEPGYPDMDIIVLVNKGSASAAEILAGALQDNKRALLLGETTFGKGSVQTVVPLRDSTAVRLTTAAYYTPSGRSLMEKGIEPDIMVEADARAPKEQKTEEDGTSSMLFEKLKKTEGRNGDEDENAGIAAHPELDDEQIRTALNILKGVRVFEVNKSMALKEDD
jgi:carboxyl-terminal processing protease